jgi:hypothetical protein
MKSISYTPLLVLVTSVCLLLNACSDSSNPTQTDSQVPASTKPAAPSFNADRAYRYVEQQVAFGPRVPGTQAQKDCAQWIQTEFSKYADTVYRQEAELTQPVSNKKYPAINFIASFHRKAEYRVLLLAHWDSRPWADQDTKEKDKPIDAADDAGSGVAVLLEIASHLKATSPKVGVDILLVDAEDVGKTEWSEDSYCLGTQYWAANPHVPAYKAMFGICLDMVGAKGARFPLEGFSQQYAGSIQKEIWETAQQIGYSSYFPFEQGGTITDDHFTINTKASIPCVDIINLQPDNGFGKHWHTHNDNISIIDKATLKAVGQTVMQVIYNQE